MNIILSDEQIREAMHCPPAWGSCKHCGTECVLIAKAQARHLLDLLNEPCTEHVKPGPYIKYHKDCPKCMEEIEKEIEDGL